MPDFAAEGAADAAYRIERLAQALSGPGTARSVMVSC